MSEEWRAIPGYEGYYEVSNLGGVRSLDRVVPKRGNNGRVSRIKGCTMRPYKVRDYSRVTLNRGNEKVGHLVHCLMAAAFIGPRPEGMEVRHLDGNADNNTLENITYGTHSENMFDQVRHGTHWGSRLRTHCKYGHEFTPDNVIIWCRGKRRCRTCQIAAQRRNAKAYRARKAGKAA